jgi:hypothetical protein
MSEIPELTLAQAFITYKFPFTLLVNYNPAGMPMPKGDMTGGGGGQWRTCATRDYEPKLVWTILPITHQ